MSMAKNVDRVQGAALHWLSAAAGQRRRTAAADGPLGIVLAANNQARAAADHKQPEHSLLVTGSSYFLLPLLAAGAP